MRELDLRYGFKGAIILIDNGSQIITHKVTQTFQALEAEHAFKHMASQVSNRLSNLREEATTYRHLVRFYDAFGNHRLAVKNRRRQSGLHWPSFFSRSFKQ